MPHSKTTPIPAASASAYEALFHALHESRRNHAVRFLHEHGHLIEGATDDTSVRRSTNVADAPANERDARHQPSRPRAAFAEKTLVPATLILFLLLHVVAAAVLDHARAGQRESSATMSLLNID